MRVRSFDGMACSIAGAAEIVGDRWSLVVLRDLTLRLSRFDQLQRSTGATPQTLAARLRDLERTGVVVRTAYQQHPVRYDYELTPMGRDLVDVQTALREWGDRWCLHGRSGSPLEVVARSTGHPVRLALVDAVTGEVVNRNELLAKAGPGADDAMLARLDERRR